MEMACFSTSLGVLKAFWQPCHSHRKGKLGLGLGTEVTVNELLDVLLEVVAVGDDVEGVTGAADEVTGEVLLELGEPGEDELEAVPLPLL